MSPAGEEAGRSQMRDIIPFVILSEAKDLMAIASGMPVEMP
jgi:hypothetical protein